MRGPELWEEGGPFLSYKVALSQPAPCTGRMVPQDWCGYQMGREPGSHSDGEGVQSHLKESEGLEYSCGAGCLPDGVHGQLGAAQIQHPQT